jgi:hypothetical protein
VEKKRNIRWVAALGSQTYGNPTEARASICRYQLMKVSAIRSKGDRACFMAFDEKTG